MIIQYSIIIQYMTYDLRPRGRVVAFARFYVGRFFNIVIDRVSSLTILPVVSNHFIGSGESARHCILTRHCQKTDYYEKMIFRRKTKVVAFSMKTFKMIWFCWPFIEMCRKLVVIWCEFCLLFLFESVFWQCRASSTVEHVHFQVLARLAGATAWLFS